MLSFDEESHTYRWNDEIVPSVTGIIREWIDIKVGGVDYCVNVLTGDVVPRQVLRGAGGFGQAIHRGCELILHGTLEWEVVDPKYMPTLEQFEKWVKDFDVKPEAVESRVYSRAFGYAGTLDFRGSVVGSPIALVDFKTSLSYGMAGVQTIAYDHAYIETYGGDKADRYVLHLPKDGRPYKFKRVEMTGDWEYFLNKLSARRFENRLKG